MPRPQSNIWQYFTVVDASDGKGRKAKCNYCSHQQACGVTRLHQHLLRKCTKIPESLHEDLLQKEAARGKTLAVQAVTQRSTMTQALQLIRRQQQQNPSCQAIEIDRALTTLANNGITDLSGDSSSLRATTGIPSSQQQQQQHSSSSSSSSSNNNRYDNLSSSPTSPSPHQYSNTNNNNHGSHSSHRHLHHHHPHHNNNNNNNGSSSSSSATITNNLASSDPMSQRMLDYNLARALFSASIPFNVVNNQEFATFLKRMRPGYAVPKPHVLQQYLLKEEHYDLIPQDQQQHSSSVSPLSPTYDSNGSNVIIAPQSPPSSSNSAAPSTSSAATISRIIHTQSISSSANGGNNGSNPTSDVGSSSTAHTSRVSVMHRPTEMDGSL